MKLKHYINQQHNGNQSEFARVIGSSSDQVRRYIDADCIWRDGRVYWPKTKMVTL